MSNRGCVPNKDNLYADEGLIGEYDLAGNNIKSYGWMPDTIWGTNPVFMLENNQTYFYHNDHLGTPQKMTDINGNVVWSATYTAFGEATVDPTSTITNNLRFAGQYFDEETGKHYNWNRYYDPKTGRYTQVDPIGFGAGDENLYRYVYNNPVGWVDQYGLASRGGPYHPPTGVSLSCNMKDSCEKLSGKMQLFMRMIFSHTGWDRYVPAPRGGGKHSEDIANLWRAYAKCQAIYEKKCGSKSKSQKCPELDPSSVSVPKPSPELDPSSVSIPKPNPKQVVATGAALTVITIIIIIILAPVGA